MTRSPTATPVTPGATSRTTPANSLPGTNGTGTVSWYLSATSSTSGKLTAAAPTRTWPAPSREPHTLLPVHHLCLFKLGIPLGELWYLHDLAAWLRANGRSSFLLTAPPLRLPGAMGGPLTPVETV